MYGMHFKIVQCKPATVNENKDTKVNKNAKEHKNLVKLNYWI